MHFIEPIKLKQINQLELKNSVNSTIKTEKIKPKWSYRFKKENSINSVIETTKGYLIAGDSKNNNVFVLEIDKNGKQLWYKQLSNNINVGSPTTLELKNNFIVSYKHAPVFKNIKKIGIPIGTTVTIDKKTNKIIDNKNIFLRSLIAHKDGYIAISEHNKISFINNDGNTVWERRHERGDIFTVQTASGRFPTTKGAIIKIIKTDNDFIAISNIKKKDKSLLWMFKFNNVGKIIWEKEIVDFQGCKDFIQIKENNYILVGNERDKNNGRILNIVIAKYTINGRQIWKKKFGNKSFSIARKIIKLKNNEYVISSNTNDRQLLLFKINDDGNILWQKAFEHTKNMHKLDFYDFINTMLITDDNKFIFAGSTSNHNKFKEAIIIKADLNADTDNTLLKSQKVSYIKSL